MRVSRAHTAQEDVRIYVCAELAASRRVRTKVTAYCVDRGMYTLAADLSRWPVKLKVFIACAGDFLIDKVQRAHSVHEDPEARRALR
jgi:hypothetical protein